MKHFFLTLGIITLQIFSSNSFYEINFETLDGNIINTTSCQGKKTIITVVSANAAASDLITYLDSVQQANTNIQVIAVPTADFGGNINLPDLITLKNNSSIIITKPFKVKKTNGEQQHPLFAWLTKSSENNHFDMEVEGEGQLFIVSGLGTLYSVLPKNTPRTIVNRVINQPFAE
jgi:glutathione peroxidase